MSAIFSIIQLDYFHLCIQGGYGTEFHINQKSCNRTSGLVCENLPCAILLALLPPSTSLMQRSMCLLSIHSRRKKFGFLNHCLEESHLSILDTHCRLQVSGEQTLCSAFGTFFSFWLISYCPLIKHPYFGELLLNISFIRNIFLVELTGLDGRGSFSPIFFFVSGGEYY